MIHITPSEFQRDPEHYMALAEERAICIENPNNSATVLISAERYRLLRQASRIAARTADMPAERLEAVRQAFEPIALRRRSAFGESRLGSHKAH